MNFFNLVGRSLGTLALGACMITSALAQTGSTGRMSISTAGAEGNNPSREPAMSANGRYVAFMSYSANLVPGDTNGQRDVFVRDRITGTTERVSVSSAGAQANSWSDYPSISADGRYVAFVSDASNLVANDTNATRDIFVYDRTAHTTTRVSLTDGGLQANGSSDYPSISLDGRYVAFVSDATDMVANDTNALRDVFVRDRLAGTTERVSISTAGGEGDNESDFPAISGDGSVVAFISLASNLVANDTNGAYDVFARDRNAGTTERVSVSTLGGDSNGFTEFFPCVSDNGRYVAFESSATDLIANDTNGFLDVFVRDRQTSTTIRASFASGGVQATGPSGAPSISGNGRYVAYSSTATDLVAGDTNGQSDVFVTDLQTLETIRASVSNAGAQGDLGSNEAAISSDGNFVAFRSDATNLVGGDTNAIEDIFARRFGPVTLDNVSVNPKVVTGGTGATGTVSLVDAAEAGGVIVSLSSGNAAVSVPASAFVPEGSASADFAITTSPISSPTAVTLTATLDAISRTATLTVRAPILTSLTLNPQIQAGSLPSVGRVNLSGPAPAGFVVTLTKNTGLIDIPVSVTVPEGATFATFDIQTQAVTGPVQAQIVARRSSVQRAAILFLYPTTLDSVTISPSTVKGGTATTGTVHLTMPAPAGGANVQLLSLNPAVASVPSVVFVPAGQTSKTFAITTSPVASTTNVSIRANRNGVYRARVVTVTP